MPTLANTGTGIITATTTGTLNNTAPSAGQLMIITGTTIAAGVAPSQPTGFTQIPTAAVVSSTSTLNAWYKVCTGSEGANIAIANSASGTSRWVSATYTPDGGSTWVAPLDQQTTSNSGGVAVNSIATGSITPTKANFLGIAIAAVASASANVFAAWTNSFTQEVVAGQQSISLADQTVTGGSGSYSSTASWTAGKTGFAETIIANFFQTSSGVAPNSNFFALM